MLKHTVFNLETKQREIVNLKQKTIDFISSKKIVSAREIQRNLRITRSMLYGITSTLLAENIIKISTQKRKDSLLYSIVDQH